MSMDDHMLVSNSINQYLFTYVGIFLVMKIWKIEVQIMYGLFTENGCIDVERNYR